MKTIQQTLFRSLGAVLIIAVAFMRSVPAGAASSLFDSALTLDGVNDYASAPDAPSLDLGIADGEDFTIETFFYVPDLTNTSTDTLFWKQGSYGLYILYSNSIQDRLIFRLYTGVMTTDYVYITYDVDLSVGWHHVAAVFDNGYTPTSDLAALYLDGNQVATGTGVDWTPGIWNSSSALNIGAYSGINPAIGWLEEARFSDIVRYSGATYTVPSAAFTSDAHTRALWHFDDAWGATSFADSSTKGNTLTGINGAHIGNTANTTFSDVPLSYWANSYVERLYSAGITGGCGTGIYCPDSTVTRAQMAVFLLKGMHSSSFAPSDVGTSTGFSDVATSYWAAAWIKQLAAEGITSGCGGGNYCPDATVTRAQMAVFLLKAKYGVAFDPSAATGVFTDVPIGYWADKWIERLASDGITSGCSTGMYCPDSSVTRAQMAVFLVKTFNLP